VFDVTNRESYEKVSYWLNEIKMSNTTENKPVIILVGNKIDAQDRTVSKTEAESFASENDMMYCETSAKQNINVQQCYRVLIEKIYNGIDPETISDNNGIRRGPSVHTKVKTVAMRKHICCVDKCCTII
jgi:GTPase SAR1 family protein